MNNPAISILVPTFNSAATISQTLQSSQWADEILVVDSFSTDDTLNICRQYGARILQHEYVSPAKQKNWAIPQCQHDWVLQMDSDEVAEPGLDQEIMEAIACGLPCVQAFRIPRKNHVLQQWMPYAGIYPDYQTRLFRRDQARFEDREVHEHIRVAGEIGTLKHHILHYGMPNLSKQLGNLDRWTCFEANEAWKQGQRFRGFDLIVRPWLAFGYRYVWQQGFRAGWRGFILCAYFAIYVFITRAKLWEMDALHLERSP